MDHGIKKLGLSSTKQLYFTELDQHLQSGKYNLFQIKYGAWTFNNLEDSIQRLICHRKYDAANKIKFCISGTITFPQEINIKTILEEIYSTKEDTVVYFSHGLVDKMARENLHKRLLHIELLIKHHDYIICPTTVMYIETVGTKIAKNKILATTDEYVKGTLPRIIQSDTLYQFTTAENKAFYQADKVSCGAFTYGYTKKLILNGMIGLREQSMCVFMENNDGTFSNLFIPAATCLKYSQSSKYINTWQEFMGTESKELVHTTMWDKLNEALHHPENLKIYYLTPTGEKEPLTIAIFDKFRQQWLEELGVVKVKWNDLIINKGGKDISKRIECLRFKIKYQAP
jgi:hypothetical protein